MGGTQTKTFHVLVIGLRNAGKTHFLHMFTYGNDSTKIPTLGFDYATIPLGSRAVIELVECTNLQALELKSERFHSIFLMVDASASFEELQTSKNMLYSLVRKRGQHGYQKVCIIYNLKPYDSPTYTFRERNLILQICMLQSIIPVSAIEIRFEDYQEWAEKVMRIFDWITIT